MAAFAIGLLASLAIQACADDYNGVTIIDDESNNNIDDKSNNKSDSNNYGWDFNNMEYSEDYDEYGNVVSRSDYEYDNKNRLVKSEHKTYVSLNGKRYLYSRNVYTYTYSDKCRYGTFIFTRFNEDGSAIETSKSSSKTVYR